MESEDNGFVRVKGILINGDNIRKEFFDQYHEVYASEYLLKCLLDTDLPNSEVEKQMRTIAAKMLIEKLKSKEGLVEPSAVIKFKHVIEREKYSYVVDVSCFEALMVSEKKSTLFFIERSEQWIKS